MTVKLLHYTPIVLIANAIRMSRDNHRLSDSYPITGMSDPTCYKCGKNMDYGEFYGKTELVCFDCNIRFDPDGHIGRKDYELIDRVGFKMKHESVLEFGYFIWEIDGISRACLQELARHRHANLTVQSTRYTLKELKNIAFFDNDGNYIMENIEKFMVLTGDDAIDRASIDALIQLQALVLSNKPNDVSKYALPESFKTKLQYGMNLRSFINFHKLRSSREALWEIRKLANKMLHTLPYEYMTLITNI